MIFLDDEINFDDYALTYDNERYEKGDRDNLTLIFFNIVLWYLRYDIKKEKFINPVQENDNTLEGFSRIFNAVTSYLQIFFDYKNLIEDYKLEYDGLTYTEFHECRDILEERIVSLIKGNIKYLNHTLLDFDSFKKVHNDLGLLLSQERNIGHTPTYLEKVPDFELLLETLESIKGLSSELQVYNGFKRIILNPVNEDPKFPLFEGFSLEDSGSNKPKEYPLLIKGLRNRLNIFDIKSMIELFNCMSLLVIQYDMLLSMKDQFERKNKFTSRLITSNAKELVATILPVLITMHKNSLDNSQYAEIIHSVAWKKGSGGKLEKLNLKTIDTYIDNNMRILKNSNAKLIQ